MLALAWILLVPLAAVPVHARTRAGTALLQHLSRLMLRAIGISVERRGSPATGPCLVVANHVSWLDVLVLAAAAPMVPVAKAEVHSWPLIGSVATRLGAVFVHRDRPRELPQVVAAITSTLRRGHRVQVFPESTTGCGGSVHLFRRAAFQAAVDAAVVIAPVTVAYRAADGGPAPVAFVADDDLVSSLRRILRGGRVIVQVHWLPVIPAAVGTDHPARHRALAARRAEWAVAHALGLPVVGRPAVPPRRDRPAARPALQVA